MATIWRFELVTLHTPSGQEGVSHVHYKTDVPALGTEPDAAEVLDIILDHFSSSGHNCSKWTAVMDGESSVLLARVREEVLDGSGDIPQVASEDINIAGTLSGAGSAQLPVALCAWIRYSTGVATRSARGGTHSPFLGVTTIMSSSGTWTTGTWWTNMGLLSDSILDPIDNVFQTTGDVNPGVYSRTRRNRGQSPYFWQLTETSVSLQPRWLRRRMPQTSG